MNSLLRRAARNLGLLVLVALPLGVVALVLQTVLFPPAWINRDGTTIDPVPAAVFQFLVLLLPVLAGGLIHQVLLWLIPDHWPRVQLRSMILLSSLVIPAVLLVFGSSASVMGSARALIPVGMIVVVYGLLAKPLPRQMA